MSLKELSDTELEAYNAIKKAKEIAIVALPTKLQGAVGKLKQRNLVEFLRKPYSWEYEVEWSKEKRTRKKCTTWVKIKK